MGQEASIMTPWDATRHAAHRLWRSSTPASCRPRRRRRHPDPRCSSRLKRAPRTTAGRTAGTGRYARGIVSRGPHRPVAPALSGRRGHAKIERVAAYHYSSPLSSCSSLLCLALRSPGHWLAEHDQSVGRTSQPTSGRMDLWIAPWTAVCLTAPLGCAPRLAGR